MDDVVNKWKERISQFIEFKLQLLKLELIGHSSSVLSYLIYFIIAVFLAFSFIIFSGLAMSEWFAQLLGNRILGYACTSLVFLAVLLLLAIFRKKVIHLFSGLFIRIMTQQVEDTTQEL